jgi:hypothetical protein
MQVCGFYVGHKSNIKTSGKMGNVIKKKKKKVIMNQK